MAYVGKFFISVLILYLFAFFTLNSITLALISCYIADVFMVGMQDLIGKPTLVSDDLDHQFGHV